MSPDESAAGPPPGFSGHWQRFLPDGSWLELECVDGKPNGRVRVRYLPSPAREINVVPWRTTRRLMLAVAVMAVVLAWVRHARDLLHAEPEFGGFLVLVECVVGSLVVLPASLALGFAVRVALRDRAYLRRLRRDASPEQCPWPDGSPLHDP
jgi:hypothetical protein